MEGQIHSEPKVIAVLVAQFQFRTLNFRLQKEISKLFCNLSIGIAMTPMVSSIDVPSVTLDPLTLPKGQEWQRTNLSYLMGAIAYVHRQLDLAIARLHNRLGDLPAWEAPDLDAIAAQIPTPPALDQLCQCFQLSSFERNILLLCVGRAIHPHFPNLCALAHQNPALNYPTFQLALKLFPESQWSALTPQSLLRRWQLLEWSAGEDITYARLQIDEGILHYLMGEPYHDALLTGIIKPLDLSVAPELQPSHQDIAHQIADLLCSQGTAVPKVQLCGAKPEQKWAIALAVSAQIGQPLYVLSSQALPSGIQSLRHLMTRWQRWVKLVPSLLLIDADNAPISSEEVSGQPSRLESCLPTLDTPFILSTPQRLYIPQCALVSFEVARPSYREQLALWQTALGSAAQPLGDALCTIVSQFNLPPATIQAAGSAIQAAASRSNQVDLADQLWQFCRLQARPQLDNLAQRIDTNATWDDLVLPQREKETLQTIATQVSQRAKVYEEWGFAHKTSRGLGLSVLFAGQSGTGKTMAAEVLAKQFKLDLYRIDLSAVISKYIGETEKNLRRIFDAAETGGAVLLFDEADALFGKRTEVKDSHDRHANVEVSYLLQRMEAYQGLAILTTNLKKSLDQAFLRRLRFLVDFPFPDQAARTEIWRRIFPTMAPTEDLKFDKLGNLSVAGGNIRTIALNAAFLAAATGEVIQMKHILQATQQEYLKLGRTLTTTETTGWIARSSKDAAMTRLEDI